MLYSTTIRGARVHNLKNISRSPHNRLTVVTGVSGSGKSSLVFDTIYAEGQRRYVESLSAYARQFLERMEKPDVDEIDGIAPPIAIRQKNTTRNPRSTVATATEIYDYCACSTRAPGRRGARTAARGWSATRSIRWLSACWREPEGSRWYVAVSGERRRARRAALRDHLFDLRKRGFNRLYQDGRTFEFSTPESLLDIDFKQPAVRAGGPARHRLRQQPAHRGHRRDLLPRGRRGDLRAAGEAARSGSVQREVRLQDSAA
jgi:excinuclease ABC subunit A